MSEDNELKKRIESKSNFELFEIFKAGYNYDMETINMVNEVIEARGGIDLVYENAQIELKKTPIRDQLHEQVTMILERGKKVEELEYLLDTDGLSKEEVEAVICDAEEEYKDYIENTRTTSKSLSRGILGGFIGGSVGGGLTAMVLINNGELIRYYGLIIAAISYFFVWYFSRKNAYNVVTLLITLGSVLYALVLGYLIAGL
jgi:hypothetical protein